ncbi:MAG: DUF4433 domain-containing protein [Bacteroidota bacterium]|nr:DUF4433 domain-containing protein [Bacteroidota bacterium]
MKIPDNIYLFRLIHVDNLKHMLSKGVLTCPKHFIKDKNYVNIGDQTLIKSRNKKRIPVKPGGYFDDYVAFYFGSRPPMLYEIQNGFNNVTKRHPREIIYIVTDFYTVKDAGLSFVITDGHAYHNFTRFFNNDTGLKYVDWNAVKLKRWNDTEEDPDRKRRKQAECLIYRELSLELIKAFIVYDEVEKDKILTIFEQIGLKHNVFIKPQWYY